MRCVTQGDVGMDCSICRELEGAYETGFREYEQACASIYFQISTKIAAHKRVDIERARYELEMHRLVCESAIKPPALSLDRRRLANSKEMAA